MRRSLLAVLVAIASFAVTSFVLIGGFALVAGRSAPPVQGQAQRPADESGVQPSMRPDADPASTAPSRDVPPDDAPPADDPSTLDDRASGSDGSDAPAASTPRPGLLSQDFRELGIDDPTTVIDESLRSACDVVGGTIAGPALCSDH